MMDQSVALIRIGEDRAFAVHDPPMKCPFEKRRENGGGDEAKRHPPEEIECNQS